MDQDIKQQFEEMRQEMKRGFDEIKADMAEFFGFVRDTVVTKEDLKEELKRFATKEDLERLATKEDLELGLDGIRSKHGIEVPDVMIDKKFEPA